MNINELKAQVYHLSRTGNTRQLKLRYPNIVKNYDLRFKTSWSEVLSSFQIVAEEDLSLADLEKSELMLHNSLLKIGTIAGLSINSIEKDWLSIKKQAEIEDIHIEEL
ncbi:MAG: hypothetical protein AAGM36_15465 [Cyanobacteria bacterium J06597_1]